ncbi:MAG: PorP/SprF family type IX secretion system membrane protein [Cytophagaceae bacterium]|nr:PorP/SprF family type IX secretion system membrane protein [Cytophagaceae bacterium]MDW8455460.1 PorP/SprF family type IX secretion system membrane protein [Cytophagaceae bacterium]
MKSNLLTLFCVVALFSIASSQQLNPTAHFMYNQLIYNPASAGMHETQLNTSLLTRLQWTAIEGAPVYTSIWGDYRTKKNKMALGVNLTNLVYSGYRNNEANVNYSYHLKTGKRTKLLMGLRAGLSSLRFDPSGLTIWDDGDGTVDASAFRKTMPKLGAGFQFQYLNKFYAGIASPDFFSTNKVEYTGDTAESFLKRKRNYIFMSGASLPLGDLYNLKPNVGVFYHPDNGMTANVNATFEIKDYFWAGLSFSSIRALTIMAGTQISSRIRFGYAFELFAGVSSARLYTHELNLMLTLDNLFRKKK